MRKRQVLKILKKPLDIESVVMLKLQVGSGVGCTNKLITKMSGQNVPRSSQFLRFFLFCGTTEQSSIT